MIQPHCWRYRDSSHISKSPHLQKKSAQLTSPFPSFPSFPILFPHFTRTASSWPLALQLFHQLSTVDLIAVSLAMKVCSRGRQWTLALMLLEEMEMQQLEGPGDWENIKYMENTQPDVIKHGSGTSPMNGGFGSGTSPFSIIHFPARHV